MKSSFKIDGFLTEKKMVDFLRYQFKENFLGSQIRVSKEKRFLWDACIGFEGRKIFVEFDGDSHYRDPGTIKRDKEKENIASQNGDIVIRIPYWIQLTNETFNYYFNCYTNIEQDYAHGFISNKAMLPSSFCELGIQKFKLEFCRLPQAIKEDVKKSISGKISKYGKCYVVPSSLEDLLVE